MLLMRRPDGAGIPQRMPQDFGMRTFHFLQSIQVFKAPLIRSIQTMLLLVAVSLNSFGSPPAMKTADLPAISAAIGRAEQRGAKVGLYICDISTGHVLFRYHEHDEFSAASCMKMAILGTVYWLSQQHRLQITPATRADMRLMIGVSNNEAANRLIHACGKANVNRFLATKLGCEGSHLANYFYQAHPVGSNVTTPVDSARELEHLLFAPELASQELDIRSYLQQARWHQPVRLVRYIDRSIPCFRKPGTTSYALNDVAYFVDAATGHEMLASFFSEHGSLSVNRAASELISRWLAVELAQRPAGGRRSGCAPR